MVRSTQISCSLHSVCVCLSLTKDGEIHPDLLFTSLCVCVSLSLSLLLSFSHSLSNDGQIHPDLLFTSLCVCVSLCISPTFPLTEQGWSDPPRSLVHFTLCVSLTKDGQIHPDLLFTSLCVCVCLSLSLYLSYFPSHLAMMVRSTQISCSLHSVCVSLLPRMVRSTQISCSLHSVCVCVSLSLSISPTFLLSLSLSNDGQIHPDLLFTSLCVCVLFCVSLLLSLSRSVLAKKPSSRGLARPQLQFSQYSRKGLLLVLPIVMYGTSRKICIISSVHPLAHMAVCPFGLAKA